MAEEETGSAIPDPSSITRRRFLILASGLAVSTGVLSMTRFIPEGSPVLRPPGVLDERMLLSLCLRCDRCAEACPTGGITPVGLDLSKAGTPMLRGYCALYMQLVDPQPEKNLKFKQGGSQGDPCLLCIDACPTGALQPVDVSDIKLGIAKVNTTTCLAWLMPGACLRCLDVCPVDAINDRGERVPYVDDELCVGCVQCTHICPVRPTAIVVEPLGSETNFW